MVQYIQFRFLTFQNPVATLFCRFASVIFSSQTFISSKTESSFFWLFSCRPKLCFRLIGRFLYSIDRNFCRCFFLVVLLMTLSDGSVSKLINLSSLLPIFLGLFDSGLVKIILLQNLSNDQKLKRSRREFLDCFDRFCRFFLYFFVNGL